MSAVVGEAICVPFEEQLVGRARAGDQGAFAAVVESYQVAIYNLCYRMLADPAEAEDAAQETFVRAYSQLARYDPSKSFKTWLFSISCHYCIDQLRKRRHGCMDIDEEPLTRDPALWEPSAGPEDLVVRGERNGLVQALLDTLSPRDRSLVVMRYWQDLSCEEMAAVTGDSISALKSRLHRARLAMARVYEALQAGRGKPSRVSPGLRGATGQAGQAARPAIGVESLAAAVLR